MVSEGKSAAREKLSKPPGLMLRCSGSGSCCGAGIEWDCKQHESMLPMTAQSHPQCTGSWGLAPSIRSESPSGDVQTP